MLQKMSINMNGMLVRNISDENNWADSIKGLQSLYLPKVSGHYKKAMFKDKHLTDTGRQRKLKN